MARGSNIGSMLAQSGLAGGQNIAQAYQQLGQGVGGMFTGVAGALERRQEKRRAQSAQEQFQQILGAYENNPDKLIEEALLAKNSPDVNLQRMGQLLEAQANRVRQEQEKAAAQRTADITGRGKGNLMALAYDPAFDITDPKQRSGYIGMASASEVPLNEAMQIAIEAKKDRQKPTTPTYDYSEETIIGEDGNPIRVQVGVNKANPLDRVVIPIGKAVPTGEKEGTKTLQQQLADAGVPDVDLTTLEGAQQARRDIIKITGNASLANSVGQIIEDLTPMSVKEGLDFVRSTNPEFVEAEKLREITSRFATLENLAEEDIAGLSALIERTLAATTENDIKAVSELARFRKAKDLPQRIKDFALEISTGRLSKETISEYSTLASAFEELAEIRMASALDNLIVYGNDKQRDAAQRAKNMILGESKARIIN